MTVVFIIFDTPGIIMCAYYVTIIIYVFAYFCVRSSMQISNCKIRTTFIIFGTLGLFETGRVIWNGGGIVVRFIKYDRHPSPESGGV